MALSDISLIIIKPFKCYNRITIFICNIVDPKSVKNPKDLPYMQRPGGSADDSDIKGKKKGGMFSFGKKSKKAEPEPEPEKKKNFWSF